MHTRYAHACICGLYIIHAACIMSTYASAVCSPVKDKCLPAHAMCDPFRMNDQSSEWMISGHFRSLQMPIAQAIAESLEFSDSPEDQAEEIQVEEAEGIQVEAGEDAQVEEGEDLQVEEGEDLQDEPDESPAYQKPIW